MNVLNYTELFTLKWLILIVCISLQLQKKSEKKKDKAKQLRFSNNTEASGTGKNEY